MTSFTETIEKSNEIMTNVQTEVKTVEEDTKICEQPFGAVKPGKSVSLLEKFALGICIRGIPEEKAETASADDGLHADVAEVQVFLDFLNIEDRRFYQSTKAWKVRS